MEKFVAQAENIIRPDAPIWPTPVPKPDAPLAVALIGAGARTYGAYLPVLPALAPWLRVTAVCATSMAHAERLAETLGARAYNDIHRLVADRPMEAALVVTGTAAHYPLSVYLSSHGIHNLVETPWASLLCQAQEMLATARQHRVIARVAENFLRNPIDRFARVVRDTGYLGRIGRVFSYADHTSYHNNSRWIAFAGCHPDWVQCIEHEMAHPPFYVAPQFQQQREKLSARFYHFPNDMLVMDTGSGHTKGHLGRHARPGYTEWQGELGTLIYRAPTAYWDDTEAELRKVSTAKWAPAQEAADDCRGGGIADQLTPVVITQHGEEWACISADTPDGRLEYRNPFSESLKDVAHTNIPLAQSRNERTAIVDQIVDFVLAITGLRASEFRDEDALMSNIMLAAAQESALQHGRRIPLPLQGELETDVLGRQHLRETTGVDPLDVEGMLARCAPRP